MSTKPLISAEQPVHWVLDWDGTITQRDTLDILVQIAASTKPNVPVQRLWKLVTDAYLHDYNQTLSQLTTDGTLPTNIANEQDLLKRLKDVEQRSLDRVSESGIFTGLTGEQLDKGAKAAIWSQDVQLRVGFTTFFDLIRACRTNHSDNFNILSVNWSRRFIAASLQAAKMEVGIESILSNELEGLNNSDTPSTGRIVAVDKTTIISSADKLQQLERIKAKGVVSGNALPIVYIGDSWTDIESLLAADLGICIRDNPMGSSQRKLAEAFDRLGVVCSHIERCEEVDSSKVVWAKDFTEISAWAKTRSSLH